MRQVEIKLGNSFDYFSNSFALDLREGRGLNNYGICTEFLNNGFRNSEFIYPSTDSFHRPSYLTVGNL